MWDLPFEFLIYFYFEGDPTWASFQQLRQKCRRLGSSRNWVREGGESTKLMPMEHKRPEEQYSWPSQHQKLLAGGKSDLGLSFYIIQFFAYTDSRNISPLSFFSEHDTRNNSLVQQSNWILQNSSSVL